MRGTRLRRRRGFGQRRFIPACAGNARSRARPLTASPVHPRVCGERALLLEAGLPAVGSSPRVRGTRLNHVAANPRRRFIPACAGNASNTRWIMAGSSVHPRVCGERCSADVKPICAPGSSPRVRGTRLPPAARGRWCRFIPACAGNAHHRGGRGRMAWGSSPRVRGTLAGTPTYRLMERFIPACAGNASSPNTLRCSTSVHPRVCGERLSPLPYLLSDCGSSPRVRGTRGGSRGETRRSRFIPACAGNAPLAAIDDLGIPVHPRVCGERLPFTLQSRQFYGSSPRVRGTQLTADGATVAVRFIPACAGNATSGFVIWLWWAVHPRVCGERRRCEGAVRLSRGSSPRVRGTRDPSTRWCATRRFIPACAGNAQPIVHDVAWWPVHPRVCGERPDHVVQGARSYGSSPRVRGTHVHAAAS